MGDLGGANQIGTNGLRDLEYVLTRPAISAGYARKVKNIPGMFKGSLAYLRVNGDDKLTQEPARNFRNLKFRAPIIELSVQYEYYLLQEQSGHLYNLKGTRGSKHQKWNVYLFAGVGAFWFNPKGPLNGRWYALQPLQTEGKRYSRISLAIPLGGGFKYKLNDSFSLTLELCMRKTFTDYIDDVSTDYIDYNTVLQERGPIAAYFSDPGGQGQSSWTQAGEQRGDPKDKDAFLSVQFGIRYKIPRGGVFRAKF